MTNAEFSQIKAVFAKVDMELTTDYELDELLATKTYEPWKGFKDNKLNIPVMFPVYVEDSFDKVLHAIISLVDATCSDLHEIILWNSFGEKKLTPDECGFVAADFVKQLNTVADILSHNYGIDRNPKLLSMDGNIYNWFEACLFSPEPTTVDRYMTFADFVGYSNEERLEKCAGLSADVAVIEAAIRAIKKKIANTPETKKSNVEKSLDDLGTELLKALSSSKDDSGKNRRF